MKHKVLIIADEFPSVSTPFIMNIVVGLIENKIDVKVISKIKSDFSAFQNNLKKYDLSSKVIWMEQLPENPFYRFLKFAKLFPLLLLSKPKHAFKAINIFKYSQHTFSLKYFFDVYSFSKIKPDYQILHAQFGPLGVMMDRLRRDNIFSGKLVTHFRGYDVSTLLEFEPKNYYNNLFKNGDLFIANCHFFEKKIISLGANSFKVKVLYSGIDTDTFKYQKKYSEVSDNSVYKLCSVSRLSGKKGITYVLDALSIVRLKNPNIKFIYKIVGDGEERNEIEKKIKELQLEDSVFLLGKKDHDFISKFLPEQDVFISHNITSQQGDQDAPVNTIKEAYLAKLPVISTYHGGIPELVFDGFSGVLTKEKDCSSLAEKIIYLHENPLKRKEFAENGYEFVSKEFDNKKITDELISIYNSLDNL